MESEMESESILSGRSRRRSRLKFVDSADLLRSIPDTIQAVSSISLQLDTVTLPGEASDDR